SGRRARGWAPQPRPTPTSRSEGRRLPEPSRLADPPAALAALARSGIMALCGWPAGPPVPPPWPLAARLAFLAGEVHLRTARQGRPVRVSWEAAVAGRAALLGLRRQGRTSPNVSCRL